MIRCGMFVLAMLAMAGTFPASAQNLVTGLQANVTFTPIVDEDVQIRLSGQIKRKNGQPAANIVVRFWQPDTPAQVLEARSDANGRYQIALTEGLWRGAACGGDADYIPAHWQTRIEQNRVTFLQAQTRSQPRIDSVASTNPARQASNSAQQNEQVVVTGQGFGCAGRLRFVYSHMIDTTGRTRPVEYGVADVVVDEFISRRDDRLVFSMPALRNQSAHQHVARLFYEQAARRSNARVFAQDMYAILPQSVTNGADVVAASGAVSAGALRNLGNPPGPVIRSGFDAAGTPVSSTSTLGQTGFASQMASVQQQGAEPAAATSSSFTATGASAAGAGISPQLDVIDEIGLQINVNLRGGLKR